MGYRYYVDELMPTPILEPEVSCRARESYGPTESEIDSILQQTCRILSAITCYTSVATPPQLETICINQAALLSVGKGKLLLITVLNSGHIDHRSIDHKAEIKPSEVVMLGNLINERFCGIELAGFAEKAKQELPPELKPLEWLYNRAIAGMQQALAAVTSKEIYLDGTANMLRQPEFLSGNRMAAIINALEERRTLFHVLSSAILGRDVTVIIGTENRFSEMQECSVIAYRYMLGDKVCGSIGVVGPTRMNYSHTVAAVRFMAENLSELLTSLYLE
jgi:heat-inducible transcriptional repressor